MPDRAEDIKPRFHRARTQGISSSSYTVNESNFGVTAQQQQHGGAAGGGGEQGSDDEDEEGSDEETSTEWNLSEQKN